MQARPHRIEFRASAEERIAIERNAREAGLPSATFARSSALGAVLPVRPSRIEAETVAALNRLGVNLNQIAKAANGNGLNEKQVRALGVLHNKIRDAVNDIKGLMK